MSKTDKQKSIPAVTLKSLGSIAPTFDMPVEVPVRGSEPATINLTCKALGKLAWARIRDAANASADERSEARIEAASKEGERARIKVAEIVEEGLQADSATVLEFATGWDLEDPLNAENLQRLEDQCGGALRAIVEAYEMAIYQSRLGNSVTRPAR